MVNKKSQAPALATRASSRSQNSRGRGTGSIIVLEDEAPTSKAKKSLLSLCFATDFLALDVGASNYIIFKIRTILFDY